MKRYEAFLIRYEMGMRKKGYKSEADRIKDVVYNNRLLHNLPDYPDTQRERLHKEKSSNNTNNIIYNFIKIIVFPQVHVVVIQVH